MQTASKARKMASVAMLGAMGFILMFIEFSVPVMPSFIKVDFSEVPSLIATFAFGPVAGVFVCLIKNALHLLVTTSGGIGEISNFILGAALVVPAGLIYQRKRTRTGALVGAIIGGVISALLCVPINYYIVYPLYTKMMPMDVIVSMYTAIWSRVDTLFKSLVYFNMPFTLAKELACAAITFLVYKRITPFLNGKK